jgi:hypothetical protein
MAVTARLAHDRTTALNGLEVLRLITDRLERDEPADPEDIELILKFFSGVTEQCPDERISHLLAELDRCFRTGECSGFVSASRSYTDTMMKILASEQQIRTEASVRPTLRRLEGKYVTPHCI